MMKRLIIDERRLREVCAKNLSPEGQAEIRIRATYTRFSEPGISLTVGKDIIGEWMDSLATGLKLLENLDVVVEGRGETGPRPRYIISFPVPALAGQQISSNEVVITIQL